MENKMPAFSLRIVTAAMALCVPLAFPALAQQAEMPLQKAIGQVTQTGPVPSLFVLNARGATLADGKLALTGASPNSIVFADRPVRAAGHIDTAQFIDSWLVGEDQFDIDPPNATVSVLAADGSVADAVVTISAPALDGDTLVFDAVVLEGSLDGASGAAALFIDRGGFGGGGGGFHGAGGGFAGGGFGGGGGEHFSNYAHVQDPHAAWYGSSDAGNRTVNHDPHNTYTGGGGYYGGAYAHPWADAAAGAAVGAAAVGADDYYNNFNFNNAYPYSYPYCGYPPYPPCN
jgi:hypothetical protein